MYASEEKSTTDLSFRERKAEGFVSYEWNYLCVENTYRFYAM